MNDKPQPVMCTTCGKLPVEGCGRVDCASRKRVTAQLGDGRSTLFGSEGTYRAFAKSTNKD